MGQTVVKGQALGFNLATTSTQLTGPAECKRVRISTAETDGSKLVHVEHLAFEDGKTLVATEVESFFVAALPIEIDVRWPIALYGDSVFAVKVLPL